MSTETERRWRVEDVTTGLGKFGPGSASKQVMLLDPDRRIVAKLARSRRSQLEWLALVANNALREEAEAASDGE